MGFFSKLKQNINHGGVKIRIGAPSSIPENQVIPVTVTITADSPQTITGIKAEIKAQAKQQGVNFGGGGQSMRVEESMTTSQTVAQTENRESFIINPGETRTINLELCINGNAGEANPLSQMNNGLGEVLQTVAVVTQSLEHVNYIYTVHASADVQGISMDPSDNLPIQILPAAFTAATQPIQSLTNPEQTQPQAPSQTPSTTNNQIPNDQDNTLGSNQHG